MSQAITFRRTSANADASTRMDTGSVGNGSFKAADLATSPRWRNSPMSFKMGSFVGSLGSRMYPAPGCSPVPGLEIQDFKMGSVSSSFDHSRFLAALSTSHTNDEGTSNYTCCGLPLDDLHALLDHFEESHVYVLDHQSLTPAAANGATPTGSVVPAAVPDHFDAMTLGGMDLDPNAVGSGSEPHEMTDDSPDTSTSSSQNSSPTMGSTAALNTTGGAIYPYYADLRNLMANAGTASPGINPTETITPGSAAPTSNLSAQLQQQAAAAAAQCIPPSLLFSPNGSPGSSRPQSSAGAASATGSGPSSSSSSTSQPTTPPAEQAADDKDKEKQAAKPKPQPAKIKTTPEELAAEIDESLIVSGPDVIHPGPPPPTQAPTSLAKPFKCPTPHCNKAYKQANGLKYHMTHGQCCFLPKDPALEGLDEIEKDKVERPFGCGVGGCERRYKNMNGLRYHYQHSGAHGAVGLALLAAGTHSVQIAAHNAALGRNSAKAAARAAAAASGSPNPTSPRSPTSSSSRQSSVASTPGPAGGHSRSSSIASNISTATAKPVVSPVSTSGMRPGQPNAPTYAQSTYYSQHQQQAQQQGGQNQQQPAGYPYVPAYPYLPATTGANGQYTARTPVFPPGTIATMATAFANNAAAAAAANGTTTPLGAPFNYQNASAPTTPAATATTAPRPHQLLRTNSHGQSSAPATAPVVATSTVTATSTGSPHAKDEDAVLDDDGDMQMGD